MLTYPTPPKGGGLYVIWLSECDEPHFYGGRTYSFKRRWRTHLQRLQKGVHKNPRMQATFNKYGVFRPEVLTCLHREAHPEAEQAWLDENHGKPGCVNISPHATGGNFVEWAPERRRRHSEIHMGITHTEEAKAKMSRTRATRPDLIEAARASLAENRCTNPEVLRGNIQKAIESNVGRKQSQATIEKRAAKHRGRKNTPETIEKMRQSALRRCEEKPQAHGESTRALISSQQKGRIWINNGTKNRRLFPEEAEPLLAEGWVRGKLGRSGSGLWAHRFTEDGTLERKRVPKAELPALLESGWIRGTGPQG
jgi:group I intron endonuclease